MNITVRQSSDGKWQVVADDLVLSEHETNSRAWRAADRAANEPINKREETADWSFRKSAHGE
ncbi:MAG: hypothetical protein ABI216_18445 [Devosia sp.]